MGALIFGNPHIGLQNSTEWVPRLVSRTLIPKLGYGAFLLGQRLQCSSFLVLACFLLRDFNILPKKELHSSLWVGRGSNPTCRLTPCSFSGLPKFGVRIPKPNKVGYPKKGVWYKPTGKLQDRGSKSKCL